MKTAWKVISGISGIALILGIILIVLGFSSGGSFSDIRDTDGLVSDSISFNGEDIKSLNIHVQVGLLTILEGDEFRVEWRNIPEDRFSCRTDSGVLYVEEYWQDSWVYGITSRFDDLKPEIYIYVPAGFVAESADIYVAAGMCHVYGLEVERAYFNVDVGELLVQELKADTMNVVLSGGRFQGEDVTAKSAEISVDVGELRMLGLWTDDCSLSVQAGTAYMHGALTGRGSFAADVGTIGLDLEGSRDDYNITVDADIGSVSIDGESFAGSVHRELPGANYNSGNGSDITLQCGLGEITLSFDD